MAASQVLNLPPAVLSQIPIATPPPGIQSNLTSPEDKGFQLTIIASIFLALGLTAFIIREYAKIFVVKKRGWDDGMVTGAHFNELTQSLTFSSRVGSRHGEGSSTRLR